MILIIISIISIILLIIIQIFFNKKVVVDYINQRSGDVVLPPNKKYITITQSGENFSMGEFPTAASIHEGVAGIAHIKMCLINLIILAKRTNRIAILPPPWLYLNIEHNIGNIIDSDSWWDKYYDMSKYVKDGVIAPKTLSVHDHVEFIGKSRSRTKYINPLTSWETILEDPEQLITLHFRGSDNDDRRDGLASWDCGGTKIGGGIGHGWQRDIEEYPFNISNNVKAEALSYANKLGKFILIHARRGDVVRGGVYWNMKHSTIDRITSSKSLIEFVKKRGWDKNTNILLISNEKDSHHFDDFKKEFPYAKLEKDMISNPGELVDNYFTYLVLMELCKHAYACYSTAHCYFHDKCVDSLKADVPESELVK